MSATPGTATPLPARTIPAAKPLPGFKEVKPVVFSSIYPISTDDYEDLAVALEKLKLNDASLTFQKDSSTALGFGFRCGFLGLLHLEVVQERLEREFDISLILTVPTVLYHFYLRTAPSWKLTTRPISRIRPRLPRIEEPFIKATILFPERYMGVVMTLCMERRGVNNQLPLPDPGRIEFTCELPLAEVIYDFYDKLKSITQGYGSFDYELDRLPGKRPGQT